MADKKYTADNIRALDGSEHVSMRPKLYFMECFEGNSLDALHYRQSVAGGLTTILFLTLYSH